MTYYGDAGAEGCGPDLRWQRQVLCRRTLGDLLDVAVTHLDGVFYDEEWRELPVGEFQARQRSVVASPGWVIDSNYNATLPVWLHACNTVVFLDLPTVVCLWGVLWRQVCHGAGQNTATGEYNRLHRGVVRYVCTCRQKMRPKLLRRIEEHAQHATVVTLTSRRQVRRWLREVYLAQARERE